MLIFESEGFLEVDDENVDELYRSTQFWTLSSADDTFELQAALCSHLVDDQGRCHVVFFCKALKRGLVFALPASSPKAGIQLGREILDERGLKMSAVNLKLSPAMRQVVFRDINGLLPPGEARKQRSDKLNLIASLEKTIDEEPESAVGKKARLKLIAEKRLDEKAAGLRDLVEAAFTPEEKGNADQQALLNQVQDLTARLEKAENERDEVRNEHAMTEGVMAAAEKRIQELEEVLVEVETVSAATLKQKQKVVELEGRIKALTEELQSAQDEVKQGRDKEAQLADDVREAHTRIEELEKELSDATEVAESLVDVETSLGSAEDKVTRLTEELETLQKSRDDLDAQVSTMEAEAAEAVVRCESLQSENEALQKALDESREQCEQYQQQLGALRASREQSEGDVARLSSLEQDLEQRQRELADAKATCESLLSDNEGLQKELDDNKVQVEQLERQLDEKSASLKQADGDEARIADLITELEQRAKELSEANEALDQERSVRKRLERGAAADEKRFSELEAQLAETSDKVDSDTEASRAEVTVLREQLAEEAEHRQEMEAELDEAHSMIETLEATLKKVKAGGESSAEKADAAAEARIEELTSRLRAAEAELEIARSAAQAESGGQSVLEKRLAELEKRLAHADVSPQPGAPAQESSLPPAKTKPLPHELRPAPKKGVAFHPDWDLEGLPCASKEQVLQAWESVFNVQLSLEGYPSQYCTAFLVILKQGKQKRLYLLFRLKKNNHTLICVPAKTPKDEASLKNAVKEGRKYLQLSGFELETLAPENVESALGTFCLEA